jgi:hypothetical protein
MPRYYAGRVSATGTINTNSDVLAVRNSTGNYTLTIPGTGSLKWVITMITPSNPSATPDESKVLARVTSTTRSGTAPYPTTVVVLLYDWWTGDPLDSPFEFIALERSGS